MYWSRSLEELHPRVAKKARQLIEACAAEDIELVVVCTYRDLEAERELHAKGRKKPGRKLTEGWPTKSLHPYRIAFDVVPVVNGMIVPHGPYRDEERVWNRLGALGKALGLEWGGDFPLRQYKEFGHFQLTEGLTLQQLREGKTLR